MDQMLENFFDKVDALPNGCWIWEGGIDKVGYGRFKVNGKLLGSHRFSYEINKSKIPEKMVLDHLCKNPSCVNPDHLEAVTQKENILRGNNQISKKILQTHCIYGHELSGENLYINPKYNKRDCKICIKRRAYEYKERLKNYS